MLHAPRAVDKTAFALEIASEILQTERKIVYVNTSDTLSDHAETVAGMDGMFVFTPAYESPDDTTDFADLVISGIEEIVAETGIRTFIIDSVSRIAALSFGRNASPAYVMKRLVSLQLRHGLSLLVIAHDSTKSADRALLTLADTEITPSSEPSENPVPASELTAALPAATADNKKPEDSFTVEPLTAANETPESSDPQTSRRERRKQRRLRCRQNKAKHKQQNYL